MSLNDVTLEIQITIDPAKSQNPGRRKKATSPTEPAPPRIPRIARLMALAIKFQDMVDRGEVRDYADIARLGYVSRARLTQIMNLLLLAPKIQEELLLTSTANREVRESQLRQVVSHEFWQDQLEFLEGESRVVEFPSSRTAKAHRLEVPQQGRRARSMRIPDRPTVGSCAQRTERRRL